MIKHLRPASLTASLLIGLAAGVPALAADAPAAPPAPATQPANDAAALLRRVNAAYAALGSAQFNGHILGHFDVGGQRKDQDLPFTSAFAAPNRFRHEAKGDVLLVSTGSKVYAMDITRNTYVQNDAPADRAALSDWPSAVVSILQQQNPSLLLALTSSSGNADALSDLADDLTRLPDTSLDGRSFPTLGFAVPNQGQITMLIDPQTSLLRQARFDLRAVLQQRGAIDVRAAEVTVDYPPATGVPAPAAAPAPADQFAWTPPPAAIAAASATPTPLQAGDSDSAAKALVGKPAPDFTLSNLKDQKVKLASTRGSVTILDFWATWCGPCVQSLPHLDELYKQESPNGLKVFAVNLQEDKGTVQPFVQKKGWSLPVLLDTDGSVAQQYGANAIPETVIIGKDGVVKNVFIGSGNEDNIKDAVNQLMKQ